MPITYDRYSFTNAIATNTRDNFNRHRAVVFIGDKVYTGLLVMGCNIRRRSVSLRVDPGQGAPTRYVQLYNNMFNNLTPHDLSRVQIY